MEQRAHITLRSESGETQYDGTLVQENGAFFVRYREGDEMDGAQCELCVRGEAITLTRRGTVRMTLRFAPGEPCDTVYEHACGSFPLRCETVLARAALNEHGGRIALHYRLTLAGQTDEHRLFLTAKTNRE